MSKICSSGLKDEWQQRRGWSEARSNILLYKFTACQDSFRECEPRKSPEAEPKAPTESHGKGFQGTRGWS